jgi:ferredoxin--NADP+ reductase
MCGACRVSVGGKTWFACVDGPEFDAHQVDFGELMKRQMSFVSEEQVASQQLQKRKCGHSE